MMAMFCYHFIALCTSKDDSSASAFCYIWRFIILWVGLLRLLSVSVVFPVAFIYLLFLLQHALSQQLGGS